MQTQTKFWSEEKRQVAERCEHKNCRLFWDNLQGIYFIVKKYADGSVLHTKETELFKSPNISEINSFIKSFETTRESKYEFWLSMFKPRTDKWKRETLRRLKKNVSQFETWEDNQDKIKALKFLLNN